MISLEAFAAQLSLVLLEPLNVLFSFEVYRELVLGFNKLHQVLVELSIRNLHSQSLQNIVFPLLSLLGILT